MIHWWRAPILLLGIYGGDVIWLPILKAPVAAGVEVDSGQKTGLELYQMAHEAISVLNSCHEDNFYIANAHSGLGRMSIPRRATMPLLG